MSGEYADTVARLAELREQGYRAQKRARKDESEQAFLEALELAQTSRIGDLHEARALLDLAHHYQHFYDRGKAHTRAQEALALQEAHLGRAHGDLVETLHLLGETALGALPPSEVIALHRRGLAIAEATWGQEDPEIVWSLRCVALSLFQT